MTNLKFPLPPAKVQAYADNNGVAPARREAWLKVCAPQASKPAPAGVPPTVKAPLGGRSLDLYYPHSRSPLGALAQLHGFYTSARWSVFCGPGRYALTGSLMHSGRSA